MLLLHITSAVIISAQLALLAPVEEPMMKFLCTDQACYSVSWISRTYARANRACRDMHGHLMTVKDFVQAEAIGLLISNMMGDDAKVWIGLERKDGCTDLLQPLRGFTWVTGDSHTNYPNWNNQVRQCSAHCVTVNKNGTWEETDCKLKADGYLCELSHPVSCSPLELSTDINVTYFHEFLGIGVSGGPFYPTGTSAHVSILQNPLHCEANGDGDTEWSSKIPGAWSCMIENGGCNHKCEEADGTTECRCPSGPPLKTDNRACPKPCDPNPCSQICTPMSGSPGFICNCSEGFLLEEDGKTCKDVDECTVYPDICENQCINTDGSFFCDCNPGYELVVDLDCDDSNGCPSECHDIDECEYTMCDHKCVNFPGGYNCTCDEGFVCDEKNPKKCNRVCNTSICEADCNENGCRCSKGYILEENEEGQRICVDVDECTDNPCAGICTNLFGTYECSCREGYTVQGSDCILLEGVPDGTEEPSEGVTEIPSPDSFPLTIYMLEPTILLGICIGIIAMLTALIAMLCHMMRRHYTNQLDLEYKVKDTENEKDVVLKQIKTIPQWKL